MRRIELEQSFSHCFQSEPFQETTSLKLITLGIVVTSLTQLPPTYAGNDAYRIPSAGTHLFASQRSKNQKSIT